MALASLHILHINAVSPLALMTVGISFLLSHTARDNDFSVLAAKWLGSKVNFVLHKRS